MRKEFFRSLLVRGPLPDVNGRNFLNLLNFRVAEDNLIVVERPPASRADSLEIPLVLLKSQSTSLLRKAVRLLSPRVLMGLQKNCLLFSKRNSTAMNISTRQKFWIDKFHVNRARDEKAVKPRL